MNFLPRVHGQFAEKDYWDKFFAKQGTNAFEWYGEYSELSGILQKYVRPQDEILVAGCGNSSLSSDLYDNGYFKISNIDISDVIIKKMRDKNSSRRPKMKWITMDVTNMCFDDGSFNVVLDKGTLDALMPNDNEITCSKIQTMFTNCDRILKPCGRYICISLLQSHISRFLLSWFHSEGWMIRIHKCPMPPIQEKPDRRLNFPVFVVVCTKLKKVDGQNPILELCLNSEKPERVQETTKMIAAVQDLQHVFFVLNHLAKGDTKEDVSVELYTPDHKEPRYTLYVVNLNKECKTKFAIFIVPQGRETEWLFSTSDGRKYLAGSAECQRLIVVHLSRKHNYENFETVKAELSTKVMELAPKDLPPNVQTQFLSLGNDLGKRTILCEGHTEASGDFVIEDVEGDNKQQYRRLIFKSNQNVVQSEAKLKLMKKKGKKKWVVDHSFLACNHHYYMASALAFLSSSPETMEAKSLIIGLGGGGLPMFLYTVFPKLSTTVIEIDPCMVSIAQKWFGFVSDERMMVQVQDGIEFLQNYPDDAPRFHLVLLDVDSKDSSIGMSCPPQAFVQRQVLKKMKAALQDDGVCVINLVCRDDKLKLRALNDIKEEFSTLYSCQVEQEVNEIVFCFKNGANIRFEDVKDNLKFWNNINKELDNFDIDTMISSLKIV